ncbi:MAG: hypothetical protein IJ048_09220 [Clostridia bacterium]|nr:hypothetical protein [Clostridia bacterium]
MMKKFAALLLCLALALSLVTVSYAEATPDIADTYFAYGYDVGFWMDYFFHFYGEVPGLGRVFYAGYALNQIVYTGTYEILAEEREYACWPDRAAAEAASEDADIPTGTAPYTIVFYDFDGNELDRCAMDETHIYNDMENLTGIGGDHAVYNLDTDPENSKFAKEYEGEQAVVVLSLVNPDDETATLELKVNGKYDDLVVLYVEGTYAMNEDQTVITLTPDDDSDPGATVTLNEDGTYTYLSTDGDEVTLAVDNGLEVAYAFLGEIPVPGMDGVNADLICELYSDGTVLIYADFMGNRMDIDQGDYEVDMTTYALVMNFETAGEITSYFGDDTMLMDYAASVEPFGDIEQTLTFVQE